MAFELQTKTPIKPPAKEVGSYSAAERAALKERFASIAAETRRIGGIGIYGIYGFLTCIIAAGATTIVGIGYLNKTISDAWVVAFAVPAFLCFAFAMIVAMRQPRLDCPGCTNRIDTGFGPYCPECGARQLEAARGLFGSPRCYACQKEMVVQRTRRYSIRACTYCGLMLDDEGL